MNRRTYLDSGVLIALAQGEERRYQAAADLVRQADRRFVSSDMAWLETVPSAAFARLAPVRDIYEWFFAGAEMIAIDADIVTEAKALAMRFGVTGADAIHAAAALHAGAIEFVTTEKMSKPIFRVGGLRVVALIEA